MNFVTSPNFDFISTYLENSEILDLDSLKRSLTLGDKWKPFEEDLKLHKANLAT